MKIIITMDDEIDVGCASLAARASEVAHDFAKNFPDRKPGHAESVIYASPTRKNGDPVFGVRWSAKRDVLVRAWRESHAGPETKLVQR